MATATNNDIAQAIYAASKESPTTVVAQTVQLLVRRRLMSRAPDILMRLEKIINKAENKIVARVTTKDKLEHKDKTELEHFLKKKYGAGSIMFEEIIDEQVVGGMKVEIGDELIDLTVKNRIRKLQEHLTR